MKVSFNKYLVSCLLIFLLIFSMSSCKVLPVSGDEELDNTDVDNSKDDDGLNTDIPDIGAPEDEGGNEDIPGAEAPEDEGNTDGGDETEKEEDEKTPEPEAEFEYIKYDIDFSLYDRPELIKEIASSDLTLDKLNEIKDYFLKNDGSIEACIDKYGIPYAYDPMQKEMFQKNADGTIINEEKLYDYYAKEYEKGSFFLYNNLGVIYVAEEKGKYYALFLWNEPTDYKYRINNSILSISTYDSSYFKELATDLNNFKWVNTYVDPDAVANSFDPDGLFYFIGSGNVQCYSKHLTTDGYYITISYGEYLYDDFDYTAKSISIKKI